MRRVSKAMVGTPQEFVHRGHVGVDDLRRVSLDVGLHTFYGPFHAEGHRNSAARWPTSRAPSLDSLAPVRLRDSLQR